MFHMTYKRWFDSHAKKHRKIIDKLVKEGLDKEAIVDYFDFDNMVEKEPKFCELYKTNTKCHAMDRLNCYLCACPNFRFDDAGIREDGDDLVKSECVIDNGDLFRHEHVIHQDCSSCTIPHQRDYILEQFDTDWRKIMAKCPPMEKED